MRKYSIVLSLFCLVFNAWASPLSQMNAAVIKPDGAILEVQTDRPSPFTVDDRLKRNVDFWIKIYTVYDSKIAIIHDAKYIDHIYEIVDLRAAGSKSRVERQRKKAWKLVLLNLHRKQQTGAPLNEEEKKVFELFKDVNEPNKFLNAAHRKRLRVQLGQSNNFLEGLKQSGRYMKALEEIFQKEGVPKELTRLPFVESSFNVRARSKVGASGIWQFMRSTGRLFLTVNSAVDERNDPIRAAEAAAKLLKMNYDSLRSWPLAVTAYNHGRKGMMRAVRKVGSDDLEDVVAEYRSRSFGFASGNFFTELLAAITVEKNYEKYFGHVELEKPADWAEVPLSHFIAFEDVVRQFKIDRDTLRTLNPGLTDLVTNGQLWVPKGYLLRIPLLGGKDQAQTRRWFEEIYAQIPEIMKRDAQRRSKYGTRVRSVKHRVKKRTSSARRSGGLAPI